MLHPALVCPAASLNFTAVLYSRSIPTFSPPLAPREMARVTIIIDMINKVKSSWSRRQGALMSNAIGISGKASQAGGGGFQAKSEKRILESPPLQPSSKDFSNLKGDKRCLCWLGRFDN